MHAGNVLKTRIVLPAYLIGYKIVNTTYFCLRSIVCVPVANSSPTNQSFVKCLVSAPNEYSNSSH